MRANLVTATSEHAVDQKWKLDQTGLIVAPDTGEDHRFGVDITIDAKDNTIIVGEAGHGDGTTNHSGKVVVYARSSAGLWEKKQTLTSPSGAQPFSWYGVTITIDDDTLAIGELGHDEEEDASIHHGAVSIYTRSANSLWTLQQQLKAQASTTDRKQYFGKGLSVSANTLVIGAERVNYDNDYDVGAAYIYVRSGSQWSLHQTLYASDAGAGHLFGSHVVIDGDTIVISAPRWDESNEISNDKNGTVYIYQRSGMFWYLQQTLVTPNSESHTIDFYFGNRIRLRGDTLVINSIGYDDDVTESKYVGRTYVYTRTDSKWSVSQVLTAHDGGPYHYFGNGLAFDGEVIAVGSRDHNNPHANGTMYDIYRGAVYIYRLSAGRWILEQQITTDDQEVYSQHFGDRMFMVGSTLAVSAIGYDEHAGAVYVFNGPTRSHSELSLRAISGIVIGVTAFVSIVSALVVLFLKRKMYRKTLIT